MKSKNFKKIMAIALAVMCIASAATLLSACGKKDYTSYTIDQYRAEEWDAKTVQYQLTKDMTQDKFIAEPSVTHPETFFNILINLYSDGGFYCVESYIPAYIRNAADLTVDTMSVLKYYGYWEEKDGNINISFYIDVDADRLEQTAPRTCTAEAKDAGYTLVFPMNYLSAPTGTPADFPVSTDGSTITYSTTTAFLQEILTAAQTAA